MLHYGGVLEYMIYHLNTRITLLGNGLGRGY